MTKRKVHAASIRAALVRISKELKASPVTRDKHRRAKQTMLLPAAEFVDAAIDAMNEPGTDPTVASQQCRRAIELLREHDDLAKVFADLDDVIEYRADYVP